MRIHVTATVYVLVVSLALHISRGEMAILLLTIGAVITAEMLNTSLEKLCDFSQRRFSPQIRIVKDIAAGAVFVAAIFAVFVGIAVLCRPALLQLLVTIATTPQYLAVLLLSFVFAWFFIFWGPVKIWEKLKNKPENR